MTRKRLFLLATLVLGFAGGAVVYATYPQKPTVTAPTVPMNSAPVVVRMVQVTANGTTAEQTYTGTIRARYETDLAFRVGAKIVSRHVEVGQRVTVGTVLFRVDPSDYHLTVKAAEADLAATEAEVIQSTSEDQRFVRLRDSGAVSSSDADRTRSARDVAMSKRERAKEALTLAKNRLSYCTLVADASGIITALPAEAGQVVAEGQIVARLAREGEREAVVSLPENQVAAARTAKAQVTLWSTPGSSYDAQLRELSPIADPVTRTYQARFTISDNSPTIALGMTATVHLMASDETPAYLLPLSSILRTGDQPAVWVVDRKSGKLTLASVVIREYRHETVVLSSGIQPGQWVVSAGVQKLDPGMTVRPWEAQ